jgi:hypothetical protein
MYSQGGQMSLFKNRRRNIAQPIFVEINKVENAALEFVLLLKV